MRTLLFITNFIFFLSIFGCNSRSKSDETAIEVDSLSLKIGSMLMVGFKKAHFDSLNFPKNEIKKGLIGGVILFDYDVLLQKYQRNIYSQKQVTDLCQALKAISPFSPLLISIDQEGGKVRRLKSKNGFQELPSAAEITTLSTDSIKTLYNLSASEMSKMGINMNMAPVVDMNINPDNPAIGKLGRSYSANADSVVFYAEICGNALLQNNIIPVLKHFPGHGSTWNDSHLGMADLTDTWTKDELIPYQKLVKNGWKGAVMSAHVFNAKIDSTYPATLSAKHLSILRDSIGYEGVIISDDLQMNAIKYFYSLKTIVKQGVNAGIDLFLIGNNLHYEPQLVTQFHVVVKELIEEQEITLNQIDNAYRRIEQLRKEVK